MSSGHSSRSSSSINTSSVSRFFPKSLSDFRLSFRAFFVIINCASLSALRVRALCLFHLFSQLGQELEHVGHDADIGYLEDWGFWILVNGNDERIAFQPS